MEATTIVEQQFKYRKNAEFSEKIDAGVLNTDQKQKEFLDAVAEELLLRREEWRNLQVSVVAGARNVFCYNLGPVSGFAPGNDVEDVHHLAA